MQKYVLGFMFDDKIENVVLIRKNRPEWQKGLLNGVGGKVEDREFEIDAMSREFKEETGVSPTYWGTFAILSHREFGINCMWAVSQAAFDAAKTIEDEEVVKVKISEISGGVDNLQWLVYMAKNQAEILRSKEVGKLGKCFLAEIQYELVITG